MIGIYCRISKHKEEGKDVSIETQMQEGKAFAKAEGLEFKIYVDKGISGTKDEIKDRPEFALMLDDIKRGNISHVYCFDQSRIERNNRIWNLFTSAMLEYKCKYYPGGKFLDLDVPENRLFTGMLSLTNEFFATLTGQKVKLAHTANSLKGKSHGITAYGYMRDKDGFLIINDEQAVTVRRIFQMSGSGIGVYTIAKTLNKDGIPTRFNNYKGEFKRKDNYTKQITVYNKNDVRWRGNVVHDLIKNPIYKGTRKWNCGENETKVPAIIDESTWDQVNMNLKNNKKNVGKRDEYHYLLNGLVFCSACGKEYRGKKRLKGRDNAYKCKSKLRNALSCSSRALSIPKLETFIIKHLFQSKDLQEYLAGLPVNKEEIDEIAVKLNQLKKELDRNKRVEKMAYDRLLDPDLTDDATIKDRLILVKKKIQENEQTIALLENKLIEREGKNRAKRIKNTIGKYKLTADFDDTKALVHSLIKKITIQHNNKKDSKGGYFLVKIEYCGFDETCTFMTNWQALKWYQIGYYRSRAITKEDLKDDKDLLEFWFKKYGYEANIPSDFIGFEGYGGGKGESIIELHQNELINYD
jgi:DNA invertase Pin-like site-specific DNA recombinase